MDYKNCINCTAEPKTGLTCKECLSQWNEKEFKMFYNADMISAAKKLLEYSDFDGSNVNFAARQNARKLLDQAASDLIDFADKIPDTNPAKHMYKYAKELKFIAKVK